MEDAKFTEKSYSVIDESITNTAKTKNKCTFPPEFTCHVNLCLSDVHVHGGCIMTCMYAYNWLSLHIQLCAN